MTSNIVLNAGSGGSTLATEQNGAAEQYQVIKLVDGTAGAFTNRAAVTAASALKVDASGAAVPITDNAANLHVQGAAASAAAKAGNPVQVGGVFNTTQPTVTTGQAVELQATARGAALVATGVDALTVAGSVTANVGTTNGLGLDATLTANGVLSGAVTETAPATDTASSGLNGRLQRLAQRITSVLAVLPASLGQKAMTASLAVTVASDQSAVPVSGTVTTTPPANASTNVAQLAGTTTDTNSGVKSGGTLRVVLATDQPALTAKLLVTPDSVALPANQSVNVSQLNAVTPLMGNGTTGTGSQRVTIASDNTAFSVNAVESGTWTVQPGNTANTTPWLVSDQAATSGGLSMYSFLSTAAVQAAAIKAGVGQVYGLTFFNTSATIAYGRLYNMTTTPASTDTANIVFRFLIPANTSGAGFVVGLPPGLAFSTGIGIRVSAAVADNDTTALAANVVIGNVAYK